MGRCAIAIRILAFLAARTKEAREATRQVSSVIQFQLRGEKPFYVELKAESMRFRPGTHTNPDATIRADAKTFLKIMGGDLDQDEAFARRKFEVEGSLQHAVRFRRAAEITRNAHTRLFALAKWFRII